MKKNLIFVLLLMFSFSLVLAVPPQTETSSIVTTTGLGISYPQYQYLPQGLGFELYIHVFNATTSAVSNLSVDCLLHINNPMGVHVFEDWANFSSNGIGFEWDIPSNVFDMIGEHAFIIQCNSTAIDSENGEIGYAFGVFDITPTGEAPGGDVVILGFSILFILLFAGFMIILINNIVKITKLDANLYDLAYSYSLYFGLLAFRLLSLIYIRNQEFNRYLDLAVWWLAFPLLVLPAVAWLLSLVNDFKDQKMRALEW